MSELLVKVKSKLDGTVSRQAILDFEDTIKGIEGHIEGDTPFMPLVHTFSDGIYVRQISIPAGTLLTGKIHKHDHPNFLLKGKAIVVTEDGEDEYVAPLSMISKAGTKRAVYAVTDLVWTTIHHNPTNTQDLDELENIVIAPSYAEFDKFLKLEQGVFNKLKKKLIKTLSV